MKRVDYFEGKPNYLILVLYLCLVIFGNYVIKEIMIYNSLKPMLVNIAHSLVGCVSLVVFMQIPIKFLRQNVFKILVFLIALLVLVLFWGNRSHGAIRALDLGFVTIQVSMFVLNFLIIYFAHILDKHKNNIEHSTISSFFTKDFGFPLFITGIIFLLILLEKHLSILIISGVTLFTMLIVAGIKKRILISMVIIGLTLTSFVVFSGKGDTGYRANRINLYKKYTLFNPGRKALQDSTLKNEYQILESLKALVNGGFKGQKHPVTILSFVPEVKNDYVFTFIGEKFGFFFASFVILFYFMLFYTGMLESTRKDDLFLKLCLVGFSVSIFTNVIVNVGVSMSALPSTGVYLPFISTGGSAILAYSITVGLILNISKLRD